MKTKIIFIISLIVLLITIYLLAHSRYGINGTGKDISHKFIEELRNKSIYKAYNLTSRNFQNKISLEKFNTIISKYHINNFSNIIWKTYTYGKQSFSIIGNIDNNISENIDIYITVEKTFGIWKINSVIIENSIDKEYLNTEIKEREMYLNL